ncbi:MAG TPA: NAD(P)/FAD-dependent oxidoreductase [Jatrophihabitans sp.]|nr:NAD(P)/FAD-dependent oxidoreductase [Jatrophihabitans sp.]
MTEPRTTLFGIPTRRPAAVGRLSPALRMALSGRIAGEDDYLTEAQRRERSLHKQQEARDRGLTPDWFTDQRGILCLPSQGVKVAVVGGGFAGLMAGWYLLRCGVDVTVYEARDLVNGRVHTDRKFLYPNHAEFGAELIGENHPLWMLLSRHFELPLTPITEYPHARLRLAGSDLTPDEQDDMESEAAALQHALGTMAHGVSEIDPWTHHRAREWDAHSVESAMDLPELKGVATPAAVTWLRFTLGNDNCVTTERQSFLGLLSSISAARMGSDKPGMLGYWRSTETHRCRAGNDELGTNLAGELGVRVQTATVVTQIQIQSGSAMVTTQRSPGGEQAVSSQPERFDYVVLTAPPSAWHEITFVPAFNPASRSLHQGAAVKFLTRYPSRFWLEPDQPPFEDKPAARWDELGSLWETTDGQPPDTPPATEQSPPVGLSVFAGGQFVQPAASYPEKVQRIFPHGDPGPPDPAPKQRFLDWPHTRYIETGYSAPAVGQVTTVCPAQLQPHEQCLYFAGEQTSSGFFGYMEGALQSGARAARDIVRRVAVPCPPTAGQGDAVTEPAPPR